MSMMVSFVLSFFPRDVLDEILILIESVSEGFPSYSLVYIFLLQLRLAKHVSLGGIFVPTTLLVHTLDANVTKCTLRKTTNAP